MTRIIARDKINLQHFADYLQLLIVVSMLVLCETSRCLRPPPIKPKSTLQPLPYLYFPERIALRYGAMVVDRTNTSTLDSLQKDSWSSTLATQLTTIL